MAKDKGNDYDVGYGKPPVEHQFKKGKSGNPKGRPPRNMKLPREALSEALRQKVELRIGNSLLRMTALEAIPYRMVQKALAGDGKALQWVIENLPQELRYGPEPEVIHFTLDLDPPRPGVEASPVNPDFSHIKGLEDWKKRSR